tara:strand:- start:131 stop:307 length:177 start_codon:yes stop_codon:yes gene_type:complete
MNITNAKYVTDPETNQNDTIAITVDGVVTYVPMSQSNSDYIEIMRQVDAGTLTIADAD